MTDEAAPATIPRTQDEIASRIRVINEAGDDMFGVARSRLLDALDFEHAKEFLKEGAYTEETWSGGKELPRTVEWVENAIREYLPFAWGKANNCRGISANRSLDHFSGLVWLLGLDELHEKLSNGMTYYGKPQLVAVSETVDVDWRKLDNNEWVNAEGDEPLTADAALGR